MTLTFDELAKRAILGALAKGRPVAAWAALERDGRVIGRFRDDPHVEAHLCYVAADGTKVDEVLPLVDVPQLLESGAFIEDIGRPAAELLFWQATARVASDTARYVVVARDYRGLVAVPLSQQRSGSSTVGQRETQALLRSSVPGAAKRVREAARGVGESSRRPGPNLQAAGAGALAEYFSERAQSDGGHPVAEWLVLRVSGTGAVEVLAGSPLAPAPVRSRRGKLFTHVLAALEQDAFGVGVQSPRSRWEMEDLPDDAGGEAGGEPLPELLREPDPTSSVIDRLALEDIVGHAGLTPRELEVVALRDVEDLLQREVADRLGIALGTVKVLESRARAKLGRAAGL